MAEILIGTSGFAYKDWIGVVYHENTPKSEFLGIYGSMFPTVELNCSYHSMPNKIDIAKMLAEGGDRLTFSIKAHRTLTHEINPELWEGEARTFLTAIEPMIGAGRLEAVLFQFPNSFYYTEENRRYLDRLLAFFGGVPAAVEFNAAEWFSGKVIEGMKKRCVSLVCSDLPELAKLPPSMDVVTAPLAYIRLNGRNNEMWWGSDVHKKYNYLYDDKEIDALAGRIKSIGGQAKRVVVYFNNHTCGKAVVNAKCLNKLIMSN